MSQSGGAPRNSVFGMTTAAYAILGAIGGLLVTWSGLRFHIGQTFFDGLAGYVGAAVAGAFAIIVIRYAVRKSFGPIIP